MEMDTPNSNPLNAAETLNRLRAGGQQVLAEIFVILQPRLVRMVQLRMDRQVAARVDAADVVQDATWTPLSGSIPHCRYRRRGDQKSTRSRVPIAVK